VKGEVARSAWSRVWDLRWIGARPMLGGVVLKIIDLIDGNGF
jgi:hypothetical protein